MPIAAAESESPRLNLFRFSGRITATDLDTILTFHGDHRGAAAGRDEVLLFEAGTDLSALTPAILRDFKRRLGVLLADVKPAMIVRTALVCREPACVPVLQEWAMMARPDDGFHTEVRLAPSISVAAAWIGLTPSDAALVEHRLMAPAAA